MTAEELLAQMESEIMPLSVESPDKCVIDPESREIVIPETYQILGVESDEKTERVWFQCPKIVGDNVDLSQYQIRINYANANGDKYTYAVSGVQTEGDNILFSWLLSRNVTAYKGAVSFIVCAVNLSGATITNEWNTTLAQAEVLEGIEPGSPEISEDQQDIITELLQLITQATNSGIQSIREAEEEAIDKILTLPKVENHVIVFGSDIQEGEENGNS